MSKDNYCSSNENEFESPSNQTPLVPSRAPLNLIPDPSQYQSTTPQNDAKEKTQSSTNSISSLLSIPGSRVCDMGKSSYLEPNSAQITPVRSVRRLSNVSANGSSVMRLPAGGKFGLFPRVSRGISVAIPEQVSGDVPHFELEEDPSFWKDHNVQVLIRIRPLNEVEKASQGQRRCLRQESGQTVVWLEHPETRFTFDHIACESTSQEKLFRVAGLPMVDNCMSGYNSCMFAYGQTGSGKTYTTMGEIDKMDGKLSDDCGITPRIFEYLFTRIAKEEESRRHERLTYSCKCSFLEIYNEQITDLLEPSSTSLHLREDLKKGVYVENLTEHSVKTVNDVLKLLQQGAANRKIAATYMNSESSRSHSVFTCTIESRWEDSMARLRFGRLNLVDLAGSERQKSSGAEGDRLKEAANINKSLSTLGLVIMSLVDLAQGNHRHVPYRDSRLTFLLQDSLGGNSKTTIIANVSPSSRSANETLSTLKFAQRAKLIQNNAKINEDASGDVVVLQQQIQHLKSQLSILMKHHHASTELPNQSSVGHFPGTYESPEEINVCDELKTLKGEFAKTKYFEATLEGALRREKLAEMEAKRLKSEIEHLNSLAHQREEESQRTRIMLRLHEEKIKRFELLSDKLISADKFYQDENNALREENLLLQAKIDMNPEVTRLALENDRLLEQIRSYQDFYGQGERQTFVAEISELRNQVLELLEVEKGPALPQFSPMKGKHVNYELEFAKELEQCKNMNSTVIREVDGLRLQIADGMNCDKHTSNSVRTSYMQLSDGTNMDGLQAKLDELACELKEAETLNRRYTEDCAREDDKKAELIRNEVELETTKTIIHLQEEIDRLQSDFKLKLCSLGEQNISLRNDLAVKEEESRMFCAEWERAILELTTFLTDGSRSLGVASCQIKSISSSFPNVNDWIGEHVEKAAKICLEKEKAILLLQKSLEDAKKDVTQMQQKLFSLMGATIALTELQQMEKSASGEESQFSKASNNSNEVKDFAENKLEVLQHIRNEIVELNKKLSYIHACFYNVRTIHCHLGSRDGVTGADGWTSDCSSSCSDSSVESEVNDEISSSDIYGCICKITEGKSDLNCDEGSSMTCNRAVLHLMKEFRKAYGAFVKLRDHLLELCVDGTNQSCVADIVSFCDQRALDDLKDHPTNQRIASSKNLGELFVEEKPYPPITFDKFEETYATIKEADDTLKAMLKANETANMSAAMWKKAGEDLMSDKASLSEEIKQLKSQDQVHFSLNEISNLLSLLEGCFLQMQTGVEEVLETTHRDAVEERSSLEDLMCKSIENDFTIFVLQRQMVEYFEKLSRAKSISTSDGFTLHDDCLITGDSELRQDESVDKNSELVNQLKRKNNLLKGLLFDFSLLQEFASHRKDIKDELEKLISALSKVQHELQIKTIQLDDLLVHNTKLEGNLAEAEQALFNSNHELNLAKDESNILSEQNVELKDLLKELYLKNSEAEQLLEEQKEAIKSLEKEIFRVSSSAKRFNSSVEDIEDTLIRVTAERDELVKTLNSLQDRFDMACALADENLAISVEARQESEARKMYAEQKEEEVKILEHSVEELECTINVLQKKVQEMEDEVEKHRLMSDSLELELHEHRHSLLTVENFTESLTSENSNAAISEDQLFRKFHGTCEETNEALDQIRILQEENAKQSKEIKLFKDYISELVLHAEAQASQYQHKYKSLETMLNEVKTDLLPNVSAASTLEGTEKISTRARGSRPSSPFKCISGLVQQMNQEKDHELAIARLRIEELEALAASRHREVCILNTRLASTESMTHDVIRDLLSVKLDISNYANIIDQHRLQSLIEDAQHQRQKFFAMEQEIVNLRGQIDDLLEERERCISEIQKSKEQQLATQITVEQVKERDQLLVAQNDMLKMDKSNLQKRIVELDDLVKKLLKMKPRNQLQTNSSSRLFDSSIGERSVDSQNMFSRINNQIAQNRQIGADTLNTRANGTKLRKHKP